MNFARRLSNVDWVQAAVFVSAVALAVFVGFAAAEAKPVKIALVGGTMAILALLAKPSMIFWTTTFATLVVAGTVKYFVPLLDRVWWLAYGMAALLYLPAFFAVLNNRGESIRSGASPLLGVCTVLLVSSIVFGSIAAAPTPELLVVSAKSLLMFSGVWAYLALVPLATETVWKWVRVLFWIGATQWIMTAFQFLFVRSARLDDSIGGPGKGGVSAADSVVGTFGGSMDSGGLTAVLAFYLVAGLIVLLGMRTQGALTRRQWMIGSFLFFFPLVMMEVKIIFVYVPVALIAMFHVQLWRRPHVFIGWSLLGVLGLVGMLMVYQAVHWSVRSGSLERNLGKSFTYSFVQKDERDTADDGAVTRRQGLELWVRDHGMNNLPETLIGHGIGASRTRGLAIGDKAIEYDPQQLDRTGLCQMLWDTGLIGVTSLLGLFFAMFLRGRRLKDSQNLVPWQRGMAAGLQGIAPMLALSLAYRNDIPYAAPMMFVLFSALGMTVWLSKQDDLAAAKVRAEQHKARNE
jgi:hypothetical protein